MQPASAAPPTSTLTAPAPPCATTCARPTWRGCPTRSSPPTMMAARIGEKSCIVRTPADGAARAPPLARPSMRFSVLKLSGVFLIELTPHVDERGFFARTFCEHELAEHGLPTRFPQCNLSRNTLAKTLRGLHFEAPPSLESKLVRCVSGAIWD